MASNPNTVAPTGVVPRPIENEMKTSYIDYAMSVIVGRALPDARDGLKPVHRRILYAMNDMGLTSDRAYRKSALVVGEVLGKYHPHGDTAVYDSLVRMAQDFSLRYPLIDGQGNFGSVDGDAAAAMRYTECRLSKIAGELLEDIDKETVDFTDNYDASRKEPLVLPGRLPNLLLNGSSGIAVGMATNMPPHRLGEVVDAVKLLIRNPETPMRELMAVLPGPDFPTGGIIQGRQGIVEAYSTGRGVVRVRAKATIEEDENRIIVTELPYMVNKANLLIAIADLVKDRKLEGIRDLRDESDRDGMRVVIELKRDAIGEIVLNNLYKHTALESSFGILNLALVDGQPVVLTLKGLLEQYLGHRVEVVTRRTKFLLRKAEERRHIVVGLLLAVGGRENLDRIIRIIRESADTEAAKVALLAETFVQVPIEGVPLRLDEEQVKAILDMRLGRLVGLEVQKLREEAEELRRQIVRYQEILASRAEVLKIIEQELDELKGKFDDPRRTQIAEGGGEIAVEDLVPDEPVVILTTNDGYIKRMPISTYRAQRRGGKGLAGIQTKEEDYVVDAFTTTTHRYILFFTNKGRVHWLKGYDVPEAQRQARGKAIVNLLVGLEEGETVQAAIPVANFAEDRYLFFATRKGTVKKTPLAEFARPRPSGLIALGIEEGDEVIGVAITTGGNEVVLGKAHGQSIRFAEAEVRSMGRPAFGVRGVTVEPGDAVVSLAVVRNPQNSILTITENGFGKRTPIEEYRVQGRGGQGIITIQTTTRNGPVVAALEVAETDEILVTSERGMVIRVPASTISLMGRNTQGNRIMRLEEGDRIRAVAPLASGEVAEAPPPAPGGGPSGPVSLDVPGLSESESPDDASDGDSEDSDTS
ncbi:MAG: DNA gyrase subunit A [Thermoplasmatota archaeon]